MTSAVATPQCGTHMPRPDRIEGIDDVKVWIAEHDGRIDAWWEAQHDWNQTNATEHRQLHAKLSAIERRVIYASGAFAGGGALLGTLIPWFMG